MKREKEEQHQYSLSQIGHPIDRANQMHHAPAFSAWIHASLSPLSCRSDPLS